jgi:hypothetical protein
MLKCLRSGLSLLAHSESGIAMPTVLTVTVISLGFGSVAALSSISAQTGSVRDYDTKTALAAADAGAERALYRHNKLTDADNLACLTGEVVAAGAWCPPVTGTVGSASYSYQVRFVSDPIDPTSLDRIEIVSSGTSDDVTRRIEVSAARETGFVFSEHTVIGLDEVALSSNTEITGGTASNGDVTTGSTSQICGNVQVGPGRTFSGTLCPGYTSSNGTLDLPNVDQGDVVNDNSNDRFFTQDIRSSARVTYDAATRHLDLGSNSSLTLGGVNYSLCRLTMSSNTDLYIAAGANVRIYFDSPENCGLEDEEDRIQLSMSSNSRIRPTAGGASDLALLFVGSESLATTAILSSNTSICELKLLLYGPRTDVLLNSNTSMCGGVAGESIVMDSNTTITSSPDNSQFELPVPLHFEVEKYVECSRPGSTPDANC